ncbi:MAG TPA: L-rhamnose mutarotase [Steroidobacteraceae bacterium]|jgi:L-rhamnose mutarotase|nr:L-rhamnose mutarotase [Steroidobacteraceae bacterium]
MKRFVFALDLVDDPRAIAQYEAWHRADRIWPAILGSLRDSGLTALEIFRTGNRLCLIMEAPDEFSLEAKAAADAASADVQAWERLMWTFQRALPWAAPGEKWVRMERIFSLADM